MARILVADDEDGVREFLAEALELADHDVEQAEDGAAAHAKLKKTSFDVLLTDLKMPKLDGLELLRRVKAESPEIEVIVLTAHGSVDSAVEAMKIGAFDYLQKPISGPAELRLMVARAAERKSLLALKEGRARESELESPLTWGDPVMAPVVDALRKVSRTPVTVLLTGESGTGKEVAARAIHRWSDRADGAFVAVNCAAIAENLIESELFGHEKGAFTGAYTRRRGCVELADGGTCFLDEVGEMPLAAQVKLLRVLQERQFRRVGGSQDITSDVRFIAATNQNLEEMMGAGAFREDLYHRIAVFPINLPPLRMRKRDIIPLVETLLTRIAAELGRGEPLDLDESGLRVIQKGDWPGNIRELRNCLERAAILAPDNVLSAEHLISINAPGRAPVGVRPLVELEKDAISAALAESAGNRRQAAEKLGIGLRTLYDKLKRYEIS